jgi:hypothetical protein
MKCTPFLKVIEFIPDGYSKIYNYRLPGTVAKVFSRHSVLMVNHYFKILSKNGGVAIGIIQNGLLYGK